VELCFWNPPAFSEEEAMPSRYPAEVRKRVVELARSGTKVAQLAETFGMTQASVYSWLKRDRIDRGEAPGLSTEGQMELAAAKRRIRQLETELAVSRKVNEVFLEQNLPPKVFPRDRLPDRAAVRRADGQLRVLTACG
jgi:transposase-like protein